MAETKFWLFTLLLVVMVFLPWVSCSPISQCSPTEFSVTVESMARHQKAKRFLLITENLNGEFSLSFTGRKGASGTKFICKRECSGQNLMYSFRPSKKPDFILAVENGQLMVKNASTVRDPTDTKFEKKKIVMTYHDSDRNSEVNMEYDALMSLSGPRAVIRGHHKSGKLFLDKKKNWKDCRAWVKIDII
ncbi:hypothetical protein AWC38_SpisGene15535 [Stylophora pistillata]|uniref:Uncharacterized protein n=2 Tax=Stylophora pistillata TaxID=50429 RepID=A0A2B4RT60_STYPI|nr:hypothetical protein AWC38_SpisGene15535 [Stylophora pistillata]